MQQLRWMQLSDQTHYERENCGGGGCCCCCCYSAVVGGVQYFTLLSRPIR